MKFSFIPESEMGDEFLIVPAPLDPYDSEVSTAPRRKLLPHERKIHRTENNARPDIKADFRALNRCWKFHQ